MSIYDEIPKIIIEINTNNYFINSYYHLTKIKGIHFVFTLIEILLNISLELEIILREYKFDNNSSLNLVSYITKKFINIKNGIKLIIIIIYIFINDAFYFFIKIKKFKNKHIGISISINIFEIFIYRVFMLIFLNLFFTLKKGMLLIGFLFLIPHIYLTINNFLYNHLYYFVPEFIEYPYDEFSSLYDIILLFIKLLLSLAGTANNIDFCRFCFVIIFLFQIFSFIYFISNMINHSYLFMKNYFLNIAKVGLLLSKTIILFIALLFGKNEIMTTLFLIISICVVIIIMSYLYSSYNPFSYIKIRNENPKENTIFYLYILSQKNDFTFVLKNKISNHYKNCRICDLCKKYSKFLKSSKPKDLIEEEKEQLINKENDQNNDKKQLMDLFDIINDEKNRYFLLIKNLVLDFKNKTNKKEFFNNSFYNINLSFLVYFDYQNHNINLALNARLIYDVLNKEKINIINNQELQIMQIMLCNHFINSSKKILSQLKDILNSESNFKKAKKLIDLSFLLKELKSHEYKEKLFSRKLENISNSKHLILICSILYEEIYNTTLNSSQISIRENIQTFEDIFYNISNKKNKLISLLVDLNNKTCKILRAGKGLNSHINKNLFDLFPLIFKKYQINLFMKSIFENFEKENSSVYIDERKKNTSTKNIKGALKQTDNNRNTKDYIEIKLVVCENISSRIYYKLLTLKLKPLFNSNICYSISFEGFFNFHKNTIVTIQDFGENIRAKEKLISVSEPELEFNKEIYSIPFKNYISLQDNLGFITQKISSLNIKNKYFNIYMISKKEKESKKSERKHSQIKIEDDDEEYQTNIKRNTKIQLMEDTGSVSSQNTGSSYSGGISAVGKGNKKKYYKFGGFNKIKEIIIFLIIISLIFLLIEYFLFNKYQEKIFNNRSLFSDFNEFGNMYFRLFSSILGASCISSDNSCFKIIKIFIDQYSSNLDNDFNFERMIMVQNEMLAKKLLDKKSNLYNIHKYLGNNKYNELFGRKIQYLRLTQNIIDQKNFFSLGKVSIPFSEAILTMCNSFNLLTSLDSEESIFILSGLANPFAFLNSLPININLDDYQKEFSEMILNFQYYYGRFNLINYELLTLINIDFNSVNSSIYLFITLDAVLLVIISFLMYGYLISFEFILIKIINYINMTINIKNDDFSFSKTFLQKIDCLECILLCNESDPVKEIHKLNNIYNKYQQFLTAKKKNNLYDANKKNNKKIEEKKIDELDNVPKNQRIINLKDLNSLGTTIIFKIICYLFLFLVMGLYILLLLLWKHFNLKNTELTNMLQTNQIIETSLYQGIIAYDLMIFYNLSLAEVNRFIMFMTYEQNKNMELINNFYQNLNNSFNNENAIQAIKGFYFGLENIENFECETIYEKNNDYIQDLESIAIKNNYNDLKDISQNLINFCKNTRLSDTKDFRTLYEEHFNYIRYGILNVKNRSFQGLIDHIINEGTISKISVFFNCIILFVLELNSKFSNESNKRMNNKMKNLIKITEINFFIFDIIVILLFVFFYISRINKLSNQILLLKTHQ